MEEPAQRLPAAARSYWRVRGSGWSAGALVAAIAAAAEIPLWLPLLVALVVAVVLVLVLPELRWRRWRYAVREDEIDLVRGAFVVRRTIIPIRRVQHVDTESGPLRDSFGLASVMFHTAAGGVGIPALTKDEAESLRTRVAELARTRDDT